MLYDILPWLEGWKWLLLPTRSMVIPAGTFTEVAHIKGRKGYVLGAGVQGDQPLGTFELLHFGPKNQERLVTASPFTLNASGLTGFWNGSGFFSPIYNAVLGIYSMVYFPDARVGFWSDEIRGRLIAPAAANWTITAYFHNLIEIVDEKSWRESLRKLFFPQQLKMLIPREEEDEEEEENEQETQSIFPFLGGE